AHWARPASATRGPDPGRCRRPAGRPPRGSLGKTGKPLRPRKNPGPQGLNHFGATEWARRDLNPHVLSDTRTCTVRVYRSATRPGDIYIVCRLRVIRIPPRRPPGDMDKASTVAGPLVHTFFPAHRPPPGARGMRVKQRTRIPGYDRSRPEWSKGGTSWECSNASSAALKA